MGAYGSQAVRLAEKLGGCQGPKIHPHSIVLAGSQGSAI